jgi:hypothetical protein
MSTVQTDRSTRIYPNHRTNSGCLATRSASRPSRPTLTATSWGIDRRWAVTEREQPATSDKKRARNYWCVPFFRDARIGGMSERRVRVRSALIFTHRSPMVARL